MNWQDLLAWAIVAVACLFVFFRIRRALSHRAPGCCSKGCSRPTEIVQIEPATQDPRPHKP